MHMHTCIDECTIVFQLTRSSPAVDASLITLTGALILSLTGVVPVSSSS